MYPLSYGSATIAVVTAPSGEPSPPRSVNPVGAKHSNINAITQIVYLMKHILSCLPSVRRDRYRCPLHCHVLITTMSKREDTNKTSFCPSIWNSFAFRSQYISSLSSYILSSSHCQHNASIFPPCCSVFNGDRQS